MARTQRSCHQTQAETLVVRRDNWSHRIDDDHMGCAIGQSNLGHHMFVDRQKSTRHSNPVGVVFE
jgi:hypothetical protein